MGKMDRITGLMPKRINYEYMKIIREAQLMIRLDFDSRKNGTRPRNCRIPRNAKDILIINTGLIGDFVTTLPALHHLIKQTDANIHLVVSPAVVTLAKHLKGIKAVYPIKSIYRRRVEGPSLRKIPLDRFNHVIVLRMSDDAYGLLKELQYDHLMCPLLPYIRYTFHVSKNLSKPVKQLNEVNFEFMGMKRSNKIPSFKELFSVDKKDGLTAKTLLKCFHGKIIVVHTGSGWSVKLWGVDKWVELIKRINTVGDYRFVFVGAGDEEQRQFDHIQKKLDFKANSMIKKLSLWETALMMRECCCFIGVDSGPRHLAYLVDLPSISLLGPGPKMFMSFNKDAIIIDKSDCQCTNLFCYKKTTCMEKINVDDVYSEFLKLRAKHAS